MKPETLIYDKVKYIIPDKSEKTMFFAAISETSYEVFFYAFFGGKPKQCFELAEQGIVDESQLDIVFEMIVNTIKSSKVFKSDQYNIATIIVDKTGIKLNVEYYEKNAHLYKIKKEWKNHYILSSQ